MGRILGVVLLVVGVILLVLGFNAKDSLASNVSETVTGNPTDSAVWYLVLGAAAAIGGLLLAARGLKR